MNKNNHESLSTSKSKVRLDKWLWAARFFKTRNLAKQAIDGGKVHCNGARCKSSREIEIGSVLEIRQGWDEKTVVVKELSDKRGGAPQAALLYQETPESLENRQLQATQRKAMQSANPHSSGRPNKQDRRLIHRFKQNQGE
ncbi:S4 domain-containing protein [Gammaproteobacteria bacterium]|nr:S4 domain-containing protein [Gammaproteobacteria bacterium]